MSIGTFELLFYITQSKDLGGNW